MTPARLPARMSTPLHHCPVRTQALDLHFMAALSQEVALIPVIAKSDCMTPEELTAFKSEVVQRLQTPGIEGPATATPMLKPCLRCRALPACQGAAGAAGTGLRIYIMYCSSHGAAVTALQACGERAGRPSGFELRV